MERAAMQLDLQTITVAIEAYRQDFGDIPRPSTITFYPRAERVLAWALIGPYGIKPIADTPATPQQFSASGFITDSSAAAAGARNKVFSPWPLPTSTNPPFKYPLLYDGAEGPGFRTSFEYTSSLDANGNQKWSGSRVWGPYLQPERWQFQSQDGLAWTKWNRFKYDLQDRWGMPIEYFPLWNKPTGGKPNQPDGIHLFGLNHTWGEGTKIDENVTSVYDFVSAWTTDPFVFPNVPIVAPQGIKYLCKALGDDTWDNPTDPNAWHVDDVISSTERLGETPPFILLSRGPKRTFSDDDTIWKNFQKCTEVSNLQPRQ